MSDNVTTAALEAVEDVKGFTAYRLANEADAGTSDFDIDGAGALFLTSVRDDVVERLTYGEDTDPRQVARDILDDSDGTLHEIADSAPDVYTFTRWSEFVDLAAWQEDISEYGEPEDLTSAAGVALYMIAERLVRALCEYVVDNSDDADDDDSDDVARQAAEAFTYATRDRSSDV